MTERATILTFNFYYNSFYSFKHFMNLGKNGRGKKGLGKKWSMEKIEKIIWRVIFRRLLTFMWEFFLRQLNWISTNFIGIIWSDNLLMLSIGHFSLYHFFHRTFFPSAIFSRYPSDYKSLFKYTSTINNSFFLLQINY